MYFHGSLPENVPEIVNPSSYGDYTPRRDEGLWHTLNRYMISAVILALTVGGGLALVPLVRQHRVESRRIEQLQAEVAAKTVTLNQRRREVELLKNDPAYLELKARDRLDMMKPGETIVRLEPAQSPAPSPGALRN